MPVRNAGVRGRDDAARAGVGQALTISAVDVLTIPRSSVDALICPLVVEIFTNQLDQMEIELGVAHH